MDLESQGRIKQVVEEAGSDRIVAVLGAGSPTALEMMAVTLKSGDPAYAGALAGVELSIPSFHILEPGITEQLSPELYERELALSAAVVGDAEELFKPLRAIRQAE